MSNILPKKSWHVYNEENREKVRHDEEQERIKLEIAEEKRKQDARDERLNALRRAKGSLVEPEIDDPTDQTNISSIKKHERFSLFPKELPESISKPTATQKELEERKSWSKNVQLKDLKKEKRWYETLPDKRSEDEDSPELTKPQTSSSSRTIEELRRKRMERESKERDREAALLKRLKR